MRKVIVVAALLLGIAFIIARSAEMTAIADTVQRGEAIFLLLAVGILAFWIVNIAASYRAIYRAVGLDERLENLVLLATAANFVNVVAPSVGMGGMAVFVSDARRKGYSGGRVTVAGVLYILLEYAAFLSVLTMGLIVLFRRNHLTSVEILASALLVLVAVSMATLVLLGLRSAHALEVVLAWITRQANRLARPFLHREILSEARAHEFAQDAANGLRELSRRPRDLVLPAALALSSKALLILILLMMFLAFHAPLTVGTLIAGFSIGYLFLIVSPTPAGIGVVEGALTLALTTLNVPLSTAAVIAMAYRGITFWLPLLFGMVAFRWVSRRGKNTPVFKMNRSTGY